MKHDHTGCYLKNAYPEVSEGVDLEGLANVLIWTIQQLLSCYNTSIVEKQCDISHFLLYFTSNTVHHILVTEIAFIGSGHTPSSNDLLGNRIDSFYIDIPQYYFTTCVNKSRASLYYPSTTLNYKTSINKKIRPNKICVSVLYPTVPKIWLPTLKFLEQQKCSFYLWEMFSVSVLNTTRSATGCYSDLMFPWVYLIKVF